MSAEPRLMVKLCHTLPLSFVVKMTDDREKR
jgi:hypothetical protein